ncbi:MAG: glycosyltransferase, partial [Bacteroidales bacterium]
SGVSEVLKYAIKVDFWDVDALADSIYGLLNYKALANIFIKYGQDEVNNLKWDNAAKQVVNIYNSTI